MSERAGHSQGVVGKSKADELVFMALGGLGEIGMNVYLYGYGPANARSWLMVDLGVTFPHEFRARRRRCAAGSEIYRCRKEEISSDWF